MLQANQIRSYRENGTMKREFYVYVERDEDGFYVGEVPQIRGCYAQGRSLEELQKNISEVIEMCLEDIEEVDPLPEFVGIQRVVLDDRPSNLNKSSRLYKRRGSSKSDRKAATFV
jgi:predicted RNase H-like HicB family nuclease